VWSNTVNLTVSTPNITSVRPTTAIAGTQITAAGTGFGASQGSGNVWLGSTYGVVASWSDTQIVANVASGSKSGVAQVLQGGVWSNTVNLTVSTPNITSVTPTAAIASTQITVTGTGFGASQGSGNIWLGSTYGVMVSWSDTQIVANVASGSKSGVAQVLQGGVWSNTLNLTVSTPNITSVTPTTAIAGTQITIAGTGFGASQGTGNVWLGSTYGVVASWTDTQVVAAVASNSSTGVAQVLQGGVWSNSVTFTVSNSSPAPVISGLTPSTGGIGSAVTIAGSYFGSTQGQSTVTFNGVVARIAAWSDTSIVAKVPSIFVSACDTSAIFIGWWDMRLVAEIGGQALVIPDIAAMSGMPVNQGLDTSAANIDLQQGAVAWEALVNTLAAGNTVQKAVDDANAAVGSFYRTITSWPIGRLAQVKFKVVGDGGFNVHSK